MATAGELTNRQIVRIGENISIIAMKTIAQEFLDINPEKIKSLEVQHQMDPGAFNRNIIEIWANRNPGSQQISVNMY